MRTHPFLGAGPSQLPDPVLTRIQSSIEEYESSGRSILEIGHREPLFQNMFDEAESGLLQLLKRDPGDHRVLFFPGGGRYQFHLIPLNYLRAGTSATYILTDYWSRQAAQVAGYFGQIKTKSFHPHDQDPGGPEIGLEGQLDGQSYVHITSNGTVSGFQFKDFPECSTIPLIADMSSDLLTRLLPESSPNVMYAGTQKNLGSTGLSVVIAQRDQLLLAQKTVPPIWNYATLCDAHLPLATPPIFNIYITLEMIRWTIAEGGVEEMERRSIVKSSLIYDEINSNPDLFINSIPVHYRSRQNVVWRMRDPAEEQRFILKAKEQGITGIKGHISGGGLRVSLYNGVSITDASVIARFMARYAQDRS